MYRHYGIPFPGDESESESSESESDSSSMSESVTSSANDSEPSVGDDSWKPSSIDQYSAYDNPNSYNMDDYTDGADLYDDYPEDFEDLSEAEDYYDDYGEY